MTDTGQIEELHGTWAVFGRSHRVPGRLRLSDGRGGLDLERSLLTPAEPKLDDGFAVEGLLIDGRQVTVLDCGLQSRSFGRGQRYFETWTSPRSILGVHLADKERPAFDCVVFDIDGLAQAVGLSGLSVTNGGASNVIGKHAAVEWEEPRPIIARFGEAEVIFRSHGRFEHRSDFSFGLRHEVLAELRPDTPMSVADIDRSTNDLISLVAFATEGAVKVRSVKARSITGQSDAAVGVDLRSRGRQWYGQSSELIEPRFSLVELGHDAASFVTGFVGFRRDNTEAAELLFEYQVFSDAMTPPDRLLYLARFLEAYHRSAVSAEGSFVQRMTDLLEGPAAGARVAFGGTPTALAEAIKKSRNFYVHYNAQDRAGARHGVALDQLADRAWCVVRSVLWSELGLSTEGIERILKTDWRYERACEESLEPGDNCGEGAE